MTKTQINHETKIKILMSAKKEFAEHGFAGARMDTIAKKTGVNKAMLHYYYGTKEQLYKEVIIYLVGQGPADDFIDQKAMQALTPSQKLASMIYCLVNAHFEALDHDFHRIIAWDFAEGKHCMKMLVKDYFTPGLIKMENIINEGIANGEFKTDNPMMSVWNFIVFIVNYINQQDIYRGSDVYPRLYGDNPKKMILDFLLIHVFKSLSVNSSVCLPEIPDELKAHFDKKICDLKCNNEIAVFSHGNS